MTKEFRPEKTLYTTGVEGEKFYVEWGQFIEYGKSSGKCIGVRWDSWPMPGKHVVLPEALSIPILGMLYGMEGSNKDALNGVIVESLTAALFNKGEAGERLA